MMQQFVYVYEDLDSKSPSGTSNKFIKTTNFIQGKEIKKENDDVPVKRKRNKIPDDQRQKFKFMVGFCTEYMTRADFVSEEAWNKFIRYKNVRDAQVAAARNKISRRIKKIINLEGVIKDFEEKNVAQDSE